jgi:hypothetical protein
MVEYLYREQNRLANERIKLKYIFSHTSEFVFHSIEQEEIAVKELGIKRYEQLNICIQSINKSLKKNKNLEIREDLLVHSPSQKLWNLAFFSAFCILIAFIVLVFPAYYNYEITMLAYSGMIILLAGMAIQVFILVKQLFFNEQSLESFMNNPIYYEEIISTVEGLLQTHFSTFSMLNLSCVYKPPLILEISPI